MTSTILKNARIVDPSCGRDERGDLFIQDGHFVAKAPADADVIDCSSLVAAPGFIDIHVHLRQPGGNAKETIKTGTRAAAAGGFTTILCMPNTNPKVDIPATVEWLNRKIKEDACVKVLISGCMTKGSEGKEMAPIGGLKKAGISAVTDDGKCVQNPLLMRNIIQYAKNFNLPVLDHCEDVEMMADGVVHEGYWSCLLGMKAIPSETEALIVARDIMLARKVDWKVHMQHLSCIESCELLRDARAKGIPVTGEATPHHIALTDDYLRRYDTNYKMNPPLRSEEDRRALIAALKDDTISVIATDHAPHTSAEKLVEFDNAPFGIIGLETAFGVCMTELVHTGELTLMELIKKLTTGPRDVLGLTDRASLQVGMPADVVLFDPEMEYTFHANEFKSRSRNTPFDGYTAKGRIEKTFVDGVLIYTR